MHGSWLGRAVLASLAALATGCGGVPREDAAAATAQRTVAEITGVKAADVAIVAVEPQDFPDASLACPEPGTAYARVVTPGARVIAEAEGRRYDVRVAGGRGLVCRRPPAAAAGSRPAPASPLVEAARADLAAQLGVDAGAIAVEGVRERHKGEALPGCAPACAKSGACGHVITLGVDDRRYLYLGSATGVQPCPALGSR